MNAIDIKIQELAQLVFDEAKVRNVRPQDLRDSLNIEDTVMYSIASLESQEYE